MIEIKVSSDFSMYPGARYYTDGEFSGQEFFDKLLDPKFEEALNNKEILCVNLDGTNGFASSFLDESFRRLREKYGEEKVQKNLSIISNEFPKYITKINDAMYGAK